MSIAQTSLLSYQEMLPKLSSARLQVYHALLLLGNASDKELSQYLRWSINRVTPRRGELLKEALIEFAYITCRNGVSEMTWQIKQKKKMVGEHYD